MLGEQTETRLKKVPMRVLIVEDDAPLRGGLQSVLELAGHRTATCADGLQASHLLESEPFDLVVLDLGLPRRDGLDVLHRWRARGGTTPVLVLSARDQTTQKVQGLDAGADDYLNKPFERTEFEARVRALLRRGQSPMQRIGCLSWDAAQRRLTINGEDVPLTRNESVVLEALMRPPGQIVSKAQLAARCSADHIAVSDNEVEVYVYRLRRKLAIAPDARIKTVRGLGYCLMAAGADE